MTNTAIRTGRPAVRIIGRVGSLSDAKPLIVDKTVLGDFPQSPDTWNLSAAETMEKYGVDLDRVCMWFTEISNHLKLNEVLFRLWALDLERWIDKGGWFQFVADFFVDLTLGAVHRFHLRAVVQINDVVKRWVQHPFDVTLVVCTCFLRI